MAIFPMSSFPAPSLCNFTCSPWDVPDPGTDETPSNQCGGSGQVVLPVACSTWVGQGSTPTSVNVGYAPDVVWLKGEGTRQWRWLDKVIGGDQYLEPSGTFSLRSWNPDYFTFDPKGFTVVDAFTLNDLGANYWSVSFSEVDGYFSIGTQYTGNGASLNPQPHNLGKVPEFMITKMIVGANSSIGAYVVYHKDLGATQWIRMDGASSALTYPMWADTEPDNSNFYVGGNSYSNWPGETHQPYVFASVPGKCDIGSYIGDTITRPSINIGFRPSFVLIKAVDNLGAWRWHTACLGAGPDILTNALDSGENTGVDNQPTGFIELTSVGFDILTNDNNYNRDGIQFLYMAIF